MAERKIDGETYRASPLPAKKSLILLATISKVVGPGLEDLAKALATRKGDKGASNAAAVMALSRIFATLDAQDFADLVEEVVEIAEIKQGGGYVPVSFDGHFSGRLKQAVAVVSFVLREQFGDFFSELLAGDGEEEAGAAD